MIITQVVHTRLLCESLRMSFKKSTRCFHASNKERIVHCADQAVSGSRIQIQRSIDKTIGLKKPDCPPRSRFHLSRTTTAFYSYLASLTQSITHPASRTPTRRRLVASQQMISRDMGIMYTEHPPALLARCCGGREAGIAQCRREDFILG